jgi:hypothetical protein
MAVGAATRTGNHTNIRARARAITRPGDDDDAYDYKCDAEYEYEQANIIRIRCGTNSLEKTQSVSNIMS